MTTSKLSPDNCISMTLPNFLIIGAAKAGTTALHEALVQHPQVCMSLIKEPNFFALAGSDLNYHAGSVQAAYLRHCVTTFSEYQQRFQPTATQTAIGDVSPMYLYDPAAVSRIRDLIPAVKLIAILRDPIDRAYSNFLHHIRDDLEPCTDFLAAVAQEPDRMANQWWWGFHYIRAGLYQEQLQRYFNCFNPEQIRIYLYEDLVQSQRDRTLQDLFGFLEIDASFQPDLSIRHNATGVPQNRKLHNFLSQTHPLKQVLKPLLPAKLRQQLTSHVKHKNLVKPALSPEIRQQLLPLFRADILKLQALIQRDLSAWLH